MKNRRTVLQLHVEVEQADIKAVELLADSSLSRGQLKKAMKNGALWLERKGKVKRLRRADRKLLRCDVLHLYFDPVIQESVPPPAVLIADEGEYSVWFKPAGMYSQGSKWGDHCSISRWAEQHLQPQRNAFIVHRLDRAASGLILLAHGKGAAAGLSALFRQRRIAKQYCVRVRGCFPTELTCLNSPLDGRPAVSHVRVLDVDPDAGSSLLAVRIETGRKHQIRRHLADAGLPVVGDRLYGEEKSGTDNLQLQAVRLEFDCPLTAVHRCYVLPAELLLDARCLELPG